MVMIWLLQREFYLKYSSRSPCTISLKWITPLNYRQDVQYLHQDPKPKIIRKKHHSWHLYRTRTRNKGLFHVTETFKVIVHPQTYLPKDWGTIEPQQLSLQLQSACLPQPHWPILSAELQKFTEENWFQENNLRQWILKASQSIIKILKFREHLSERLGALKALMLGHGDCDEFTDLIVSLARLRGIPARRLTGYSINPQKQEVTAHAWAEIYSFKLNDWIPVDIALNIIGKHPSTHVIMKIEQNVSEINDYMVNAKNCRNEMKFEWQEEKITLLRMDEN